MTTVPEAASAVPKSRLERDSYPSPLNRHLLRVLYAFSSWLFPIIPVLSLIPRFILLERRPADGRVSLPLLATWHSIRPGCRRLFLDIRRIVHVLFTYP